MNGLNARSQGVSETGMHRLNHLTALVVVALALASAAHGDDALFGRYEARDSLAIEGDDSAAAARVLEHIAWEPAAFDVRVGPGRWGADAVVSFASARPVADVVGDRVLLLWYAARDEAGAIIDAPAAVVVHTVHPQMIVGRMIAAGLSRERVHGFVLVLPGFDVRAQPGRAEAVTLLERAGQAVADVRRARDAVAALPHVQPGAIALQGTSLGGFVAATAAALDDAFDPVLLALSGVHLRRVLEDGRADAAVLRLTLARHGYVGEALDELLASVEPAAVMHRLSAQRTWLFSARHDQVVPPAATAALAEALGLGEDRHEVFDANHYSAVLHLPRLIRRMAGIVNGQEP